MIYLYSVIFKSSSGELVCVVEILKDSQPAHIVTRIVNVLLDEHQVVPDTICFVKRGHFPRSRLREKQRRRIAVAYQLAKL
jgi:acyl-CoA synthetase (AMP-forming)/AMP-acid ligase II